MKTQQELKLMRFDLEEETAVMGQDMDPNFNQGTVNRDTVISHFKLPIDSIIKLYYEGKLIPWSMVSGCTSVEIQVFRPHQNVKPQISDGRSGSNVLMNDGVKRLENRIASLEPMSDTSIISSKTEHDLQVLTKQIAFLSKRMDLADQTEWSKKP